MKKLNLILLIPCLLGVSSTLVTSASTPEPALPNSVIENLKDCFNEKFKVTTSLIFEYETGLPSLIITDQFDSKNRINVISYKNEVLQEVYISSDENDNVVEQFLTVSNTVENRYVTDSNGNFIKFSSNYSSPFTCFTSLNKTKLDSYFDVEMREDSYILRAKKVGYGVISNLLLNFYADFDSYVWDNTVSEYIENYQLEIDKDGTPLSYSFDKIKKDIYGGIKERYKANLTIIDEVDTLKPHKSNLDSEKASDFNEKMSSFQELLNKGNFTQTITFDSEAFVAPFSYSNYFALNGTSNMPGSMICSYPLEETTKGETYVCIINEGSTSSPSFAAYGLSPSSNYYASLTSENYTSIEEIVPRLGDISSDFFTYSQNLYKFNFKTFKSADSYFCGTFLTSLFGISDPFVQYVGFYLDDYSYNFNSLTIGFDEFGYPYGTLSYNYYSYVITSSFSFSNVGTTDLTECEDIKVPLDYIRSSIL